MRYYKVSDSVKTPFPIYIFAYLILITKVHKTNTKLRKNGKMIKRVTLSPRDILQIVARKRERHAVKG